MKVISVVNTKGGTGKSTIAVNIAAVLVERGYKVMLFCSFARYAVQRKRFRISWPARWSRNSWYSRSRCMTILITS